MNNKTSQLCRTALCTALLCISAYINIPLPFTGVSITAQTFVVNLTALLLKPVYAVSAQLIYTLIGIIGIPVFSGGKSGIGTLMGPTGGYLIGFIAAVFLISSITHKKKTLKRYIISTIFIGIPVIYIFGVAVMSLQMKKGIWALLTATVLPFIPLDAAKCIAASYIGIHLNRIFSKTHISD